MRGIIGCVGVSAVLGMFLAATAARADDKKVPLDKVPQKVMAAVKSKFPGAELTSVEQETAEGDLVYDIELQHKGRKYEIDMKEDGTVLEIEKEVAVKDLSEAVTKALKAKYSKATIKEAMEVNKAKGKEEKLDHYEVVLETPDQKTTEVTVSFDGKTIKEEGQEKKEKE